VAKKVAKKTVKKVASKRGAGILAPMNASPALQAIVKAKSISRGEMMKKVWAYIKKHELQDPDDKRTILPDALLSAVIGKKAINMFKMTAKLSEHLTAK